MKEANTVKLYRSITNIEDKYIEESLKVPLKKKDSLRVSCKTILRQKTKVATVSLAACLCLAVGISIWVMSRQGSDVKSGNRANGGNNGNSNGLWGDGDCTLSEARRSDFSPELSPEAEIAFADVTGVMKFYKTLDNEWFLADNLTDFSQVLKKDIFYILPGSTRGSGGVKQSGAYSVYTLDENGEAHWGLGVSALETDMVPYQFSGLTYDIIEEDLAGVNYEDYIIAQSNRLYTVFIWARCADGQDVFVTYPARPEFVGLENRGRYTLKEIQDILSQVYFGS